LDTLERISQLPADHHLFLADASPDEILQFAEKSFLPQSVHLHRQKGRNLGERMWNAYREVLPTSPCAVFLGTDTPSLPLQYIRDALEKLPRFQVVVGPVEDGGYCLLALSKARRDLFQDIDWGTSAVLTQTRSKLQTDEYYLLPPWYDIDTAEDLERLKCDLRNDFEGFPTRTFRFLSLSES
jgi:uncharacterized protein